MFRSHWEVTRAYWRSHENVVMSPNIKETLLVLDDDNKTMVRKTKLILLSSERIVHNDLCNAVMQGALRDETTEDPCPLKILYDPQTQKCIVSDTMMRACKPGEIRKATKHHKLMCGCVTCITMTSQLTSLNAFRKKLLGQLLTEANNEIDADRKVKKYQRYHD